MVGGRHLWLAAAHRKFLFPLFCRVLGRGSGLPLGPNQHIRSGFYYFREVQGTGRIAKRLLFYLCTSYSHAIVGSIHYLSGNTKAFTEWTSPTSFPFITVEKIASPLPSFSLPALGHASIKAQLFWRGDASSRDSDSYQSAKHAQASNR